MSEYLDVGFKNIEDKRAYARDYYHGKVRQLKEMMGNACEFCGYDEHPEVLEFAHKDASEKSFSVTKMLRTKWELVLSEAAKCYLLCPTCHRLYDLGMVKPTGDGCCLENSRA